MINAAIVGIGKWGRTLVQSVQSSSTRIRFVAGSTRTAATAQDFARANNFRLYDRFEDVLACAEVDAVVLATPHSQHAAQIKAAAEAGKSILVEKPVTLRVVDFDRAAAAAAANGVVLAAGHNRRFLPAMQELFALVRSGGIGMLLHMEGHLSAPAGFGYQAGTWRADPAETPAGGLAGAGIHVIDAMVGMAGPAAAVFAQSCRLAIDAPVDDTTSILLRFCSGCTGYVGAVTASAPTFRFQAFGTLGAVEMRGHEVLEIVALTGEPTFRRFDRVDTERLELEAFADAVSSTSAYPVPLEDVRNGIGVMEAVERSSRLKRLEDVAA